jgi:hypothetical protein
VEKKKVMVAALAMLVTDLSLMGKTIKLRSASSAIDEDQ